MGRRGQSVEETSGAEDERPGADRGHVGAGLVYSADPCLDGRVSGSGSRPESSGDHDDVGRIDVGDRSVGPHREVTEFSAVLTRLASDEDDLVPGDRLEDFVGSDGVEGGELVVQHYCDLHSGSLGDGWSSF